MKKPFVSIIITTFNEQKYIDSCLSSIFKNKFKNFEIIIVDDASTDNTAKIIRKYPFKRPGEKRITFKIKPEHVYVLPEINMNEV